MPGETVIDAHVHTYPSREIGRQAMMGSGRTDYGGTPDELLGIMDGAGITHAVMVNMTPFADMMDAALASLPADLYQAQHRLAELDATRRMIGRLQRRNQWTCEVGRDHPQLIPFIGLDPSMSETELLQEIDDRHAAGARGIKLHPAAQRFYPNDPRLRPVYERAQALGWPIIFHSGAFALAQTGARPGGPGRSDHALLRHFPEVLAAFPRLTVVMGHMGFGEFDTCAAIGRDYANAMFDCCYVINGTETSPSISDAEAAAAIRKVGADRVMFGSDYPWFDPALDAARIQRLPLSDGEKRAVLYENAARVFGL
jgi:predicted TIM-barrel fold metal-dependent hydrolase